MRPTAAVAGHRLRVAGDLRQIWRVLAALPGAKWDRGAWTYPATPVAADAVQRCGVDLDPAAGELAAVHAERSARLAAMRAGAEPPAIDGLWRHQRAAVHVAELPAGHLLDYAMRCVSGEAVIRINRAGAGRPYKLADAWAKFRGVHPHPWDPEIPTYCRALVNGELRQHRIVDIYDNGVRECVQIKTVGGKSIEVTPEHLVLTVEMGWTRADQLPRGAALVMNGQMVCAECGTTERLITDKTRQFYGYCFVCCRTIVNRRGKPGKCIDQSGYVRLSGMEGHPRSNGAGQVYEHVVIMERYLGRPIRWPEEHVHHINGDRADNRIENLQLLSQAEHLRHHADHLAFDGSIGGKGGRVRFIPTADTVASVEPCGPRHTYDISTEAPHHNFVANGFVVHNSGKTRIALTVAAAYSRVLVVCPLKVIDTWPEQAALHGLPLRVVGLKVGTVAERLRAAMGAGPCTVVVNYEAVWREPLGDWVLAQPWDLVIADEVHRLAAPGGKASRFMARLAERVQHRIGLSGTPVGDGPGNAYGIFRFLDAAVFGTTAAAFQARYVNTIQLPNGARIPNPNPAKRYRNTEEFSARYNLITLKGDRDAADLPPESDTVLHCDLPAPAARAYASMRDELIAELRGGTITAANALVKATKLHQLAAGHIRHEDGHVETVHGEKAALLAEVLDEIGPAEPLVVFCWYRADLAAIEAVCRAAGVAYHEVSGARDDLASWRGGAGRVLAVQIQAGGVGVDLSRAVYAVYWTACFSHPLYVQSRARLLGQQRAVSFTHLVSRGTIDEAIYRALDRKADILEELLRAPETAPSWERGVEIMAASFSERHGLKGIRRGSRLFGEQGTPVPEDVP